MTQVHSLNCPVQPYDWGKIGSSSIVAQLGGLEKIDEKSPYAELWMGTHPSGPSHVQQDDQKLLLKDYIKMELPYLFKVLSIHKCLSIQAHPDQTLAKKLHTERPHLYKDPNHKPEMAVAVTKFEAMCGFREGKQIAKFLETEKEFRTLVGEELATSFITTANNSNTTHTTLKPLLKQIFTRVMTIDDTTNHTQLDALMTRLGKTNTTTTTVATDEKSRDIDVHELIPRLHQQFPRDVGCWAPYLLNSFTCIPGEAVFLAPNVPHAYISGDIIECMACSDNVVRAGCTPKHRDTDVLCDMLTYETGMPSLVTTTTLDTQSIAYVPPVHEFYLTRTHLSKTHTTPYTLPSVIDPAILLVYAGSATIQQAGQAAIDITRGMKFIIPAGVDLVITPATDATDELMLYRCSVNHSVKPVSA